jgi:hypothetical protein
MKKSSMPARQAFDDLQAAGVNKRHWNPQFQTC